MRDLIDFNLQDIITILNKWKKVLITFLLSTMILASLIVFFALPKKYLATAVCLPSNPVLSDRSFIFNENIQNLYATYGSSPELDRLVSTANLDTLYRFGVAKFNLQKRYKISTKGALGLKKTIKEFKKHYNIEKTILGELKIHTWDKDPVVSAQMANALVKQIGVLLASQNNGYNAKILKALEEEREKEKNAFIAISNRMNQSGLSKTESELNEIKKKGIAESLVKYDKLIAEFTVAVQANAPGLQVQEYAMPQAKPDKPKKARLLLMIFVLTCFFAVILMFTLEKRSK